METEFIYWSHKLPNNIEVVEICGGEDKSPALWKAMALQLFADHSEDGWRSIGHYPGGAPYLEEEEERRISVTHTPHFMAIAMAAPSDRVLTAEYEEGYALGIDAEKKDRDQVLKIRERFLNAEELGSIPAEDIEANILAWTIKEAVYKAMLIPGLDFRRDIRIESFPEIKSKKKGVAVAARAGKEVRLTLCSWISEGHVLTVAY